MKQQAWLKSTCYSLLMGRFEAWNLFSWCLQAMRTWDWHICNTIRTLRNSNIIFQGSLQFENAPRSQEHFTVSNISKRVIGTMWTIIDPQGTPVDCRGAQKTLPQRVEGPWLALKAGRKRFQVRICKQHINLQKVAERILNFGPPRVRRNCLMRSTH